MKKKENFSEWYSYILKEAQLIDLRYNLKGFLVILPWAMKTIKLIYEMLEKELEREGYLPTKFPILIPESNLKAEEEHIKGFEGEVFWVTKAGFNELEEKLALRPTSETAMYPMFALWIQGRKDLPVRIYQSGEVWRYETKATKPFIRVREIVWIEAHTAFATEEEAMDQVKKDVGIMERIVWQKFGIPFIVFKRPQWDKFAGAKETFAADTLLPDGKALQIATTHYLGENFAKVFNVKFMDEDGKEKLVKQTCYGLGISRIYAALLSIHGDDKGLILPFHLSPIQVVIVPIYKSENKQKIDEFVEKELLPKLSQFRVYYDKGERTPGYKFNYWEMKGVPLRIEVGEREIEERKVVVVTRHDRKKYIVDLEGLKEKIVELGWKMFEEIKNKAEREFKERFHTAESFDELREKLQKGGFVRVPFCSIDEGGKGCYEKIKNELKAEVRGVLFPEKEKPVGKCIVCGREAKHYVYVARQY